MKDKFASKLREAYAKGVEDGARSAAEESADCAAKAPAQSAEVQPEAKVTVRVLPEHDGAQGEAQAAEVSDGGKSAPAEKKPRKTQSFKEISVIRKIIMFFSAGLGFYSLLPVFCGLFTAGTLPLLCMAAFFFLTALYWNLIRDAKTRWMNALIAAVAVIVAAGVALMGFVSGMMIAASERSAPDYKTRVTVVVLGCLVIGDQPSNMLRDRLDVALNYLSENPEAYCIVTGGQGPDEEYSEAEVMRTYLEQRGISPTRIIAETKSTDTVENLKYSAELIEQYNCYPEVIVVTDRFHQFRAQKAAQDAGLTSYALCSETRWYMSLHYWFREIFGICIKTLSGDW